MKFKTKQMVERFAAVISAWPGVECISLNEAAMPDTLDPYFALILDIYYNGPVPRAEERRELYGGDLVAFESTGLERSGGDIPERESKDRFIVKDLPVRLEYKPLKRIEELVDIAVTRLDSLWLIKDSGTYSFYRLAKGDVIFSRSDWILNVRGKLENLGAEFWNQMRAANQSKMEHFLSDLGAALIQGDEFNYLISAAGFIKSACLTLFCINRCFEPSHRAYYKKVLELKTLPSSFAAELETFLSPRTDTTLERKFSLAQLIAKKIHSLGKGVC